MSSPVASSEGREQEPKATTEWHPPRDRLRCGQQPFKGHTLAEAGQSWWAPLWLLVTLRILSVLSLAALAMYVVLVRVIDPSSVMDPGFLGWFVFLSTAFWGPFIQATGLALLVVCGLRGRSDSSDSSSPSRLPNIAYSCIRLGVRSLCSLGWWSSSGVLW